MWSSHALYRPLPGNGTSIDRAPIARRSRPEVDDPQDVRIAAGLRHALNRLELEGGSSGPAGERLLEALGEHCDRLAPVVQRRSGHRP